MVSWTFGSNSTLIILYVQVFVLKKLLMKKEPGHVGNGEVKIIILITFIALYSLPAVVTYVYYMVNGRLRDERAPGFKRVEYLLGYKH